MLKDAIEKIESMANPYIYEAGGRHFLISRDSAKEIFGNPNLPASINLYSLDSVVKMVKKEAAAESIGNVYINVPTHLEVNVFLSPDKDQHYHRANLYCAKATDVPGWEPETKLSFDRAAVALQTRFQSGGDRDYALQLLSQITTGAHVTYNDTGVATTIVTQKGVSLQQNTTIKPIVKLRPYRTFQEIDQPEGLFLIRIDERGITFIEADGGMWKLRARETIRTYLETALEDLIKDGKVTVML